MNEKYLVTIYQKVYLNETVLLFRNAGTLSNVYIDLTDELNEITFYDQEQRRITLEYMESPYVFISDDAFCYGYPIAINDFKKMHKDIHDEDNLFRKYAEETKNIISIAIFNSEKDSIRIISTTEDALKNFEDENLFNFLTLSYDSNEEEQITLELNDFKKILSLIEKEDYIKAKEKATEVLENLKKINETDIIKEKPKEKLEDILNELNDLTGLDNIKQEIYKLMKYLKFRLKVKDKLNLDSPNLHMFFSGNPGTGKTTVARIISKLLYNMGYIKKNTFAEITPKDLIAGYVGQTAIKTAQIIEKNKGGVIFIDEAYILAGESQRFAEEALVEILKELEKNETVFIFAGYTDKMENLMSMNPGLTSRIGYYLEYKDYTKEELYKIFQSKINKIGLKIDDSLKQKIINSIENIINQENFGNGRYIDKLVNKIILEHAIRTDQINNPEELITLNEEDWNNEIEDTLVFHQKTKTKKIGFTN